MQVIRSFWLITSLILISCASAPPVPQEKQISPEEKARQLYHRIGTGQLEFYVQHQRQSTIEEEMTHWHKEWSIFLVTAASGERWCSARTPSRYQTAGESNLSAIRADNESIFFLITNPRYKPRKTISQMRVETSTENGYHTFDTKVLSYETISAIFFPPFEKSDPGFRLLSEMTKGDRIFVRSINEPIQGMSMEVGIFDNEGLGETLSKFDECVSMLSQ